MPLGCRIESASPRAEMGLAVTYAYPRQGVRPAKRLTLKNVCRTRKNAIRKKERSKKAGETMTDFGFLTLCVCLMAGIGSMLAAVKSWK